MLQVLFVMALVVEQCTCASSSPIKQVSCGLRLDWTYDIMAGLRVRQMIQTPIVSCGSSSDAGSGTVYELVDLSSLPGITCTRFTAAVLLLHRSAVQF